VGINLRLTGSSPGDIPLLGSVSSNRERSMDKFRVTLTDEERTDLECLVSVGKGAARKLTHARILLLADVTGGEACSDEDIVASLGCSLRTIARVRKRFVTESLDAAVSPRPQPSRPDKIKVRAISSSGWSSWRAAIHPVADATGRSACSVTKWWPSGWSNGSARRPYGRR
jgi:hypothetical protein